jgi:hypothetical protein
MAVHFELDAMNTHWVVEDLRSRSARSAFAHHRANAEPALFEDEL